MCPYYGQYLIPTSWAFSLVSCRYLADRIELILNFLNLSTFFGTSEEDTSVKKLKLRIMIIQNGKAMVDERLKFNRSSGRYEWRTKGGRKFQEAIAAPTILVGTEDEKLLELEPISERSANGYVLFRADRDNESFSIYVRITCFAKQYAAIDSSVLQKDPFAADVMPERWR